jgi:hypothetical protein
VLKLKKHSLGSTLSRVAKVIFGALLLLAILRGNIPSLAVATGPMCTLACCAGRAPHAAGSCMNGLCHAGLMAHRRATHIHHELPTQQAEQFCGLPRPTARASVLSLPVAATVGSSSGVDSEHSRGCRASRKAADRAIISASALAKPCQPECGAGTFGSTNQRRPRQTAALSFANRAQRPSSVRLVAAANTHARARDILRWQANPRAPPVLLSWFS